MLGPNVLPELCYLPCVKTPTVSSSGSHIDVNHCEPKAQFKKKFEDGTVALDDAEFVEMFSKTFAVDESLNRKFLEDFEYMYLRLKKEKRSEERKRKNKRKS